MNDETATTTDDRVGRLQVENEALEARVGLLLVRVRELTDERNEKQEALRDWQARKMAETRRVQEAERALRKIAEIPGRSVPSIIARRALDGKR